MRGVRAPASLAVRLTAGAAVWCALALSAGGYALSSLFADAVERNLDARLAVYLEGLVAGSELSAAGELSLHGQLGEPRFEQPLSGWYWQIERDQGPLLRSASLWDQTLGGVPAADPRGQALDLLGPDNQELRVLARAISLPDAAWPLTYVVAGARREIAADTGRFDRLLALALGALFAGLLAAIMVQVRFGLGPLRRIGRGLAAIRAGQATRLEGRFPTEIKPLAQQLNALLDHSERLVERAQTHIGNLAHGLKTPLAVLQNEVANRAEDGFAVLVGRQVAAMRTQVDRHLARARTVAGTSLLAARTPARPVLDDLARTLRRLYVDRDLWVTIACPADLAVAGARQDIEEMLGNLLDNACKWAAGRVEVRVERQGETLLVTVDDDGPGLPPERRLEVLERGRRLDQRVSGSGLGLAIVADLAEQYGGRIELGPSPAGGLRASLTLPAAEPVEAP